MSRARPARPYPEVVQSHLTPRWGRGYLLSKHLGVLCRRPFHALLNSVISLRSVASDVRPTCVAIVCPSLKITKVGKEER